MHQCLFTINVSFGLLFPRANFPLDAMKRCINPFCPDDMLKRVGINICGVDIVLVKFDEAYSLVDVGLTVFDRMYLDSLTPFVDTPFIGLDADDTPESSD